MELKVGLHCDECIKKILKAIKKIEGNHYLLQELPVLIRVKLHYQQKHTIIYLLIADIETYNVDTKLNKVIVTGNVTNDEVIRVLQKIGKQATTWESD